MSKSAVKVSRGLRTWTYTTLLLSTACADADADTSADATMGGEGLPADASDGGNSPSSTDSGLDSSSGAQGTTGQTSGTTGANGIFDVGPAETSDDPSCDPEAIPDTVEFTLEQTIDVGVSTLQAAYYDTVRDEVTVLSFGGEGRVLDTSGNVLREVSAPPEALPSLDGGAYDAERDIALLIRQNCTLVEVDPATMMALDSTPLADLHDISICAGIAIAPNGNRYIASYGTDELVVVAPVDHALVFRRDLAAMGFTGIDGIAEIAGSDNFLVNSTIQAEAMIIDEQGQIVVAPGAFGGSPLSGAIDVDTLDSMVTICDNGHTWLCDEYSTTCSDFAPSDGDKQACGCLVEG